MELLVSLIETFGDTLWDVAPIIAVVFGFQLLVIRRPIPNVKRVATGFVYVLVGMAFFIEGLERALFPLGRLMAYQLTDPDFLYGGVEETTGAVSWGHYYWVYIFAAAIGFATTIAEPSLIAVAIKARSVSGGAIGVWGLRIAVAIGAAVGVALGSYRIVTGTPLHYYIMAGYVLVIVQTLYAPKAIIALAYDSGGVTTSTVTVPLVTALGLGLAGTVPGRSPVLDGFGLIAFTCLFPIMSVLGYAQITQYFTSRAKASGGSGGKR